VQRRLDENPKAMRQRRETVEHPFATIKARMGAMHFLMKTLPRVSGEMALHVLAYNLTRVINIVGKQIADRSDQGMRSGRRQSIRGVRQGQDGAPRSSPLLRSNPHNARSSLPQPTPSQNCVLTRPRP
jgi:hypothetical protein